MQLYRLDGKVLTLAWVLLGVAITAEVTGTLALKASDGLSRPWAAALVAVGYMAAFAFLGLALRTVPVGVAYAIWSGLGTVGAAVGGRVVFGEQLRPPAIAGIAVVVVGVAMITSAEVGR